jgi:hypothetical protein
MMHMYVKCVAVVAALAMVAVGTTSALTEEERTAEIAKLMDQLSTLKQADARVRGFPRPLRAPAAIALPDGLAKVATAS